MGSASKHALWLTAVLAACGGEDSRGSSFGPQPVGSPTQQTMNPALPNSGLPPDPNVPAAQPPGQVPGQVPTPVPEVPGQTPPVATPDGGAQVPPVPVDPTAPAPVLGTWVSRSLDANNSRHVVGETKISTATAGNLARKWVIEDLGQGMTASPMLRDGILYFGDWYGDIYAVHARTGDVIWNTGGTACGGQMRATLMVSDSTVYVACGGRVVAYERATGTEQWTSIFDQQSTAAVDAAPKLVGNLLLVATTNVQETMTTQALGGHGTVAALQADTGAVQWTLDLSGSGDGVSVWSSPAVDESRGLMFFGTGNSFTPPASQYSDALVAVNYTTGQIVWWNQFTANDVFTSSGGGPGPDVDIGAEPNLFEINGQAVVGVGSKSGLYRVMDRDSGATVWSQNVTNGGSLGGIHATAAVDDPLDRIYVVSNRWTRYGFTSGNNPRHDPGDVSILFALDARTGGELWSAQLDSPCLGGGVTLANGVVFTTTIRGSVFAHDSASGNQLWQSVLGHDQAAAVTVSDGWVFTGSGMVAFGAPLQPPGGNVMAFSVE